jgi:signal transduction histidine kinase/CheY-like chemotaxis protein
MVQWFISAIVFVITLLPITMMIDGLRRSVDELKKEFGQRARVESELRLAVQSAQQATVAKSQFLANMSHEIRTPMNAIIGMLRLLLNTELTAQQKDYAVKSDGAAHSLLGLLNDILDFSKVEAGKLTLERVPFRLDQVLRNLSVVLAANVGNKGIEVLFDIDPQVPLVLLGDPTRLQQVLVNLGGNAIKFTDCGQVVLSIRQVSATTDGCSLNFAVHDSGIGITPENQKNLFSAFSQAESSTTRRFGGTGLGLSICKRLVEMMGGDIHLTSAPGVGSTFSFTLSLPVAKDIPVELQLPEHVHLPDIRALVIDDNAISGELLVGMVKSWGGAADLVMSGEHALARVEQIRLSGARDFPYAFIYVDWQMPQMDGWETVRRMREASKAFAGPEPRIMMVTSNGRETLAQRSQEEQDSLNGFLVKPITAAMLQDATRDVLAGKSGIRQMVKGRSSKRRLNGIRVLVVEDNLLNQQVADELLTTEGAIVSLAANGQLGVEAVSSAAPQFDVVLMDIQMPAMDGYVATQIIREELGLKLLPIVAMTANAMASDREACLSAGMNEHIGKPFDMRRLVAILLHVTGIQVSDEPRVVDEPGTGQGGLQIIHIPNLDLHAALARMSGMRSLYARSARDFLCVLDTVVLDLKALVDSKDTKKTQMFLHTLKGNAGTLGATELAREAARLGRMCSESDHQTVLPGAFESLAGLCRSTHESLSLAIAQLQGLANAGQGVGTPVKKIQPAASSLDLASSLEALRGLDALLCSDDLSAMQTFAELRGTLQGLPEHFDDAMDDALQGLDLGKAHSLCSEAVRSIQDLQLNQAVCA